METLGVIGNISRDRVIYSDGRNVELLGGAALHVALAATRAGLSSAPVAVIGSDLGWIRDDVRLAAMDLSCVEVAIGRSCSFRLAYDENGALTGTDSAFGVATELTRHALDVLGRHQSYHVCCRRPLDVAAVLGRLAGAGIPFSIDFHLASAGVNVPAADTAMDYATAVFVNTAEYASLERVTDSRRLRRVVIEVIGAGDTLAGTFLGARARGLNDQAALEAAVSAATEAVNDPGLVIAAQ